jgi:type VI secretion system protein
MFERTLLERVAEPSPEGDRRLRPNASAVAESVLRHLRDLLNLRRGTVLARPDMGMPDFNDLVTQFPVAIEALAAEVRQQIAAFEPRLADIEVRPAPDPDNPLALRLHIAATLRLPQERRRIRFDTVVGDDGRWRLEP